MSSSVSVWKAHHKVELHTAPAVFKRVSGCGLRHHSVTFVDDLAHAHENLLLKPSDRRALR